MESISVEVKNQTLKATLTYFGSFLAAICLLIAIHEVGHALAFLISGYGNISITVNPFMGVTSTTDTVQVEDAFLIAAGGTIFDIIIALLIALILWKFSSNFLLPLKMYSVLAFLTEGVVIFAGFFFNETYTDFAILIELGLPAIIVGIISAVLLLIGGFGMYEIWRLLGIKSEDSFFKVILINAAYPLYFGTAFVIMGLILGSSIGNIKILLLIDFVTHLVLLIVLTLIKRPILSRIRKILPKNIKSVDTKICIYSLILGFALIGLSLSFLN